MTVQRKVREVEPSDTDCAGDVGTLVALHGGAAVVDFHFGDAVQRVVRPCRELCFTDGAPLPSPEPSELLLCAGEAIVMLHVPPEQHKPQTLQWFQAHRDGETHSGAFGPAFRMSTALSWSS